MSIKRKRSGPVPIFQERWKELATDEKRLVEATKEYRSAHPSATLVEAAREVRHFNRTFKQTWGNRK